MKISLTYYKLPGNYPDRNFFWEIFDHAKPIMTNSSKTADPGSFHKELSQTEVGNK